MPGAPVRSRTITHRCTARPEVMLVAPAGGNLADPAGKRIEVPFGHAQYLVRDLADDTGRVRALDHSALVYACVMTA